MKHLKPLIISTWLYNILFSTTRINILKRTQSNMLPFNYIIAICGEFDRTMYGGGPPLLLCRFHFNILQ